MKLLSLYSNEEHIFPRIDFFEGFNVVFARVSDATKLELDAHNLGKTFLASVINFALLAHVGPSHPFKAVPDRFANFVFYLDLLTNDGQYVTIRRSTTGRSVVALHIANTRPEADLRGEFTAWTHEGLSADRAPELLDQLLDLAVVAPYAFRKVVGYFLTKQGDYQDIFRIAKYARGKDRDSKPIIARM